MRGGAELLKEEREEEQKNLSKVFRNLATFLRDMKKKHGDDFIETLEQMTEIEKSLAERVLEPVYTTIENQEKKVKPSVSPGVCVCVCV